MRGMRLLWLAGPLAVRDLVAGSTGTVGALVAFIAGCAVASTGALLWFGYFGVLGVVSLTTGITQLRRVSLLSRGRARDDEAHTLPLAA